MYNFRVDVRFGENSIKNLSFVDYKRSMYFEFSSVVIIFIYFFKLIVFIKRLVDP